MDRIFACILSQLERIEEKVDCLTQTLDDHGKILDEHGKILNNLEKSEENCDRTDSKATEMKREMPKNASNAVFNDRKKFENDESENHSSDESDEILENESINSVPRDVLSETVMDENAESFLQNKGLEKTKNGRQSKKSTEDIQTQELSNKVTASLNKLKTQNLEDIIRQIEKLLINNEKQSLIFACVVFNKAVTDSNFSERCAKLSDMFSKLKTNEAEHSDKSRTEFKTILLDLCQKEFEEELNNQQTSQAKSNKPVSHHREEKQISRLASLCRFIGELYKSNMLETSVLLNYMIELLKKEEEKSLESLCELLTTVGEHLEAKLWVEHKSLELNPIIEKLAELVHRGKSQNAPQISPKVRGMIQFVLNLSRKKVPLPVHVSSGGKWVPPSLRDQMPKWEEPSQPKVNNSNGKYVPPSLRNAEAYKKGVNAPLSWRKTDDIKKEDQPQKEKWVPKFRRRNAELS